ncbi:MAG: RluA family pseudouridine synthase [Chloroflexi bacterium]|nr:RluA family pseudouridine synthase [Chloroflexota bacterium]
MDNIPVLYADDHILVIVKPAGLHATPDGWNASLPHVREVLAPRWGRLWLVHRLDKDTSGVLLLARHPDAHRELNRQFETRTVRKTYHAIVFGEPSWQKKSVTLRLSANRGRRKRTVVDPKGKEARTDLRVLRRFSGVFSLMEARPHTGRRHQVRVHLFAVGHPVVNDPLYGVRTTDHPLPIARLALHARRLEFRHPATGEPLGFTAPHPPDFVAALENLAAYGHLYAEPPLAE